ncbi:MAG: DUF3147 family protein [Acetobacter orientalis]|uniref:DUF3147 family protein n=1 Tax=Acetobacter orientalis TaxID=146474 RepID=UPI0039E7F19F
MFFAVKVILSGLLIAAASSLARRLPAFGALISILGMLWLWAETHDASKMEQHVFATFWYVLPSLPMFLLIPWLMQQSVPFYTALLAGCCVTIVLYGLMLWLLRQMGIFL